MSNEDELSKAETDALLYGTGYLRKMRGGEWKHLPAEAVWLDRDKLVQRNGATKPTKPQKP